jgi:hypothetical protein
MPRWSTDFAVWRSQLFGLISTTHAAYSDSFDEGRGYSRVLA